MSGTRSAKYEWLTVEEVCKELRVSRRSWDRWRERRTGPKAVRLARNGPIRVRRDWLDAWLEAQAAA
ncbi:helix-turn-helix transcriptional regulator [Nonomuraea typhae]|uniref:helix-turn-helix transcriptional regulator n=1 Tax=Nonomuraea typhae TaxID=2603600 RepID=UPI001FE5961B|nr:helix-turn-helix domain-containing protein [Nonomuraea typhae]